MGCRLHWARTYKVDWEGGWFNWNAEQFKEILRELDIQVWDGHYDEDDYVCFEIGIDAWKKLKKILSEVKQSDWNYPVLGEDWVGDSDRGLITWKDLKDWFDQVDMTYDSDNDYIKFEWF